MGLPLAEGGASNQFCQLLRHHTLCNENMTKGKYPQQDKVQGIYNFVAIQNIQVNFSAKTTLLTHGRS